MRQWYVSSADLHKETSDGTQEWSEIYSEPFFNEKNFMLFWGYLVIAIAAFVLFTQDETKDAIKIDENEQSSSLRELYPELKRFIFNRKILLLYLYIIIIFCLNPYYGFIGSIYLLDELKYSQTKYSILLLVQFFVELICSFSFSKLMYSRPFQVMFDFQLILIFLDFLIVNILFYNFNTLQNYSELALDV